MRLCHPLTLTAGSRDGRQSRRSHPRIGLEPTVEFHQPHLIVFSPRAIFPGQVARSSPCAKNLTESPFAHNLSKPGLEVL